MLTRSIQLKQPLTKKQTGLWPDVVHPLQDLAWLQFCTLPSCFKTGMVTCSSFYHSGPGLSMTTWREISFPEYLDMKKLDQVRQEATEYCWRIKSTISSGRKSEVPWAADTQPLRRALCGQADSCSFISVSMTSFPKTLDLRWDGKDLKTIVSRIFLNHI